jgi:hypothetical protein
MVLGNWETRSVDLNCSANEWLYLCPINHSPRRGQNNTKGSTLVFDARCWLAGLTERIKAVNKQKSIQISGGIRIGESPNGGERLVSELARWRSMQVGEGYDPCRFL